MKQLIKNFIQFVQQNKHTLNLETNLLEEKLLKNKTKLLLFGHIIILLWQCSFLINIKETNQNRKYARKDASGFMHRQGRHFFYFQYYLGLYPLYSPIQDRKYSAEGAKELILKTGSDLVMEKNHWSRLGENLRIYLYYPYSLVMGGTQKLSIIPSNIIYFNLTLHFIWLLFALNYRRPILGALFIMFLGSSSYLRHEVYGNNNIFAYQLITFFIGFSICFGLIYQKSKFKYALHLANALFLGILIGVNNDIRSEARLIIPSIIFLIFFLSNIKILQRILFCLTFVMAFVITDKGITKYFDYKFEEAAKVVKDVGGVPYTFHSVTNHPVWHPIVCGLGDFDDKYGAEWNDLWAYKFFIPKMNEKFGTNYQYTGQYHLGEYYTDHRKYYKKIDLMSEYEETAKEWFLTQAMENPLWYLKILLKRSWRFFTKLSPVGFSIYKLNLRITHHLIPILLCLAFLIWLKKWKILLIAFGSLPVAASSLIIYSGRNATFNNPYHYVIYAFTIYYLISFWYYFKRKKGQI